MSSAHGIKVSECVRRLEWIYSRATSKMRHVRHFDLD
jgi:hypothetical protein